MIMDNCNAQKSVNHHGGTDNAACLEIYGKMICTKDFRNGF